MGFWGASFLLGIVFCFFIVILTSPYVNAQRDSSKALIGAVGAMLFALAAFQGYTSGLITKSGVVGPAGDYPLPMFDNITLYLPFIFLCVYEEIKKIFFSWLSTGQQFISFFIIFARLQLIALVCFFLKKYISDALLYLIVYSICFFPIRIFEQNFEQDYNGEAQQ